MLDGVNPYASPRDGGGGAKRELRAPERPWVTRGLAIGLALNLAAVPAILLLYWSANAMRRGGSSLFAEWLEGACYAIVLWVAFALPVVSLVALCYTAFADRHTKWWRTKSALSVLLLLTWVTGCTGILMLLTFTAE